MPLSELVSKYIAFHLLINSPRILGTFKNCFLKQSNYCDFEINLELEWIFDKLEKEMATHSSVLAWRIPGTGEPGGLLSMGSHRVGHD